MPPLIDTVIKQRDCDAGSVNHKVKDEHKYQISEKLDKHLMWIKVKFVKLS